MKKILFIVNYYFPYISGISEYLRLIAEELSQTYDVTVLTSNHNKLSSNDVINGVKVIRAPIILKISKGTISPQFILLARKLSKEADIVNLHLPMIESGIIASIVDKKKIVATYQCDVNLPKTLINNLIVKLMDLSNDRCLARAKQIVVLSYDYALNSRVANKHIQKLLEISPPIKNLSKISIQRDDIKNIGFFGRIVEEKGIDVLLKAFKIIKGKTSNVRLTIAGDYKNVAGGSIYDSLVSYIKNEKLTDINFIGRLPEEKIAEFYSSIDVFVLPSINTLEAFGMVQVEAMKCGVPVVASDLPGVRTIVQKTGMGLVSKRNDEKDLANCILAVLDESEKYIKSKSEIDKIYSLTKAVEDYKNCFDQIIRNNID
jgi:glycosyltransferase involved in cell wall biosynthesis